MSKKNKLKRGELNQFKCESTLNVTRVTDLMGPPHHKVGEDINPYNRSQEGDHKKFLGLLEEKKQKHGVGLCVIKQPVFKMCI